jgi:hypothetical protein
MLTLKVDVQGKIDELMAEKLKVAMTALDKIRDPRKRHSEPDKYTELGCVMNIADVAMRQILGEPIDDEQQVYLPEKSSSL